ncbi:DUF262 domain-containing protein [Pedobacter sp. N23S346]|uniref:DUF262 domain-containing protein n=1 Tax=Pedobacter sp. N23S346 TaxID=3402750 RepID=UPI003AD291C9
METLNFFTIDSISKWNNDGFIVNQVDLPKLQRGFVWKPEQIANLWDSVLRGFPIGSFLLAINKENGSKELLDGQQRSTSILAGYYNQFVDKNSGVFSLKRFPSIWIDVNSIDKPEENEFSIHVVTQSHPWGFSARNPGSGLSLGDRRQALGYYKSLDTFSNYLEISPEFLSPWDSVCPIPLSFLLIGTNTSSYIDFKQKINDKLKGLNIKTKHRDRVNYEELNSEQYEMMFEAVQNANRLMIPELTIDVNAISIKSENIQDPTLFVRLNAGGTRIGGEELVYSIFKAYFPECKALIEQISADYIAPSRLINLFAKMANVILQKKEAKHISFSKTIDIKVFKRLVQQGEYKVILRSLFTDSVNGAKSKFELCLSLLESNEEKIPVVLIKQILSSNTDLFYTILSYFEIHDISSINQINELEIRCINSVIMHLSYFSIDKGKSATRLFQLLMNDDVSKNHSIQNDWGGAQNILLVEGLIYPLLSPENVNYIFEVIINYKIDFYSDNFKLICQSNKNLNAQYDMNSDEGVKLLREFIERVRFNKDLILIAQRDYITKEFEEFNQFQDVEDTNRPWDWDHIYPISWVYYRKDIHWLVKQWINANGNFRALSIAENRSENNRVAPKDRLAEECLRDNCFINNKDYEEYWSHFSQTDLRITDIDDIYLSHYLKAVLKRTYRIYKEWFDIFIK